MEKSIKTVKIMKYVGTLVYIIATAIIVISLLLSIPQPPEDGSIDLSKLGYVLVVIIFTGVGFFVYLIPTIMGIVGIAITRKRLPDEMKKGNAIYFTLMATIPLITDVLCFLTIFLLQLN